LAFSFGSIRPEYLFRAFGLHGFSYPMTKIGSRYLRLIVRSTIWAIVGSVTAALIAFTTLYITNPGLTWNLISIFPKTITHLPFKQSIENNNFFNAVHLFEKQLQYSRWLGDTRTHHLLAEETLSELVNKAYLADDYAHVAKALSNSSLPITEHIEGLRAFTGAYTPKKPNPELFPAEDLSSEKRSAKFDQTRYQRFHQISRFLRRGSNSQTNESPVCQPEKHTGNPLTYLDFSYLKTSDSGFGVPLIVAEYWDELEKKSLLSSPMLLDLGYIKGKLLLPKSHGSSSNLRFHIFSKPGTIAKLETINIGEWSLLAHQRLSFLKHGFFIGPNTLILTKGQDTLTFELDSSKWPQGNVIEVTARVSLAPGVMGLCD
jgi:hypothetical protein